MEIKTLPLIDAKFTSVTSPVQKNLQVLEADAENFGRIVHILYEKGYRLAWVFGTDDRSRNKTFGVHAIMSADESDHWIQISTNLPEDNPRYPALTRSIIGAIWFERYLMDMFGVVADGHPDPRRLVHHENVPLGTHPLRKDFSWNTRMKHDHIPYPMMHVEGNGIYEIPVGPIHAGIIEPGHFRFNVGGERIISLEGKLFFTHKGVEKLLEGKSIEEALPFVEKISDDSAVSHALAFVQAVEIIAGVKISEKAKLIRTLLAELERLTMHIHDISNIAGMGTGYTIMAAQGFKIKEDLVRLSQKLFGNRFWRGIIQPGGVARDFSSNELAIIREVVVKVIDDIEDLLKIGLGSDGLLERFISTGILKNEYARAYGAVGLPARASGVALDVRKDHPYAAYDQLNFDVVTKSSGDVYCRFMVRVGEVKQIQKLITALLEKLGTSGGKVKTELQVTGGEALAAVEGWRGEILHFVRLDGQGRIERMAVRDPSFCNWPLFGEIGPGNIVPDFPLCNKSLNLSYSGCDL